MVRAIPIRPAPGPTYPTGDGPDRAGSTAHSHSVLGVQLEEILLDVEAAVTIAHADHDQLSSHAYAADLAQLSRAGLLILPNAPHSWPVGDGVGFCRLVDTLLGRP